MQRRKMMAKNQTRRIASALLSADREAFDALQGITNYAPANQTYKTENIKAIHDRMDELQREATQAAATAAAKEDALIASEWEFHNAVLGSKIQVTAQFGDNSDEVAAVGLKKKSEYKAPTRRKPGGGSSK
jgi:ABC-type Zn uptake system ZnuABC Zn-binding protein ZnuA